MMDPVKVAGVLEWPVPTTNKDVHPFLAFVNFYRRFIEGFSHLARPLFDLTKNDSIFYWSSNEQPPSVPSKRGLLLLPFWLFQMTQSPSGLRQTARILQPEQSYLSRAPKIISGTP
jgi:hypothetical protein